LIGLGGPLLGSIPGLLFLSVQPEWLRVAIVIPFLGQAVTLLPIFNDSPWHRVGWLRLREWAITTWKGGIEALFNHRKTNDVKWLTMAVRGLLAFVSATVLSAIGILLAGTIVAFVGDAAGWRSFDVAVFGLKIYGFHAGGPEGGFYGEFGDGTYYLAMLIGLANAAMVIHREWRKNVKTY
jgi:hypothetical protein